MPTTTPNLGLEKPTVGADADTWGVSLNNSLDTLDSVVITANNTRTLTNKTLSTGSVWNGSPIPVANGGTGSNNAASARAALGLGSVATMTAPSGSIVGTTDFQTLTNKTINGANNTIQNIFLNSQVAGVLPVANGGTGGSTAADARTNLGASTVGSSFFTLTNPGSIAFPRINANSTVSALNAADFRTAIGAGDATTSSTQTLTNKQIVGASVGSTTIAPSPGATTISLGNASDFIRVTLAAPSVNISFTLDEGKTLVLLVYQDGTGSRTATWPANTRWPGGAAPTLSSVSGRWDAFRFTCVGGVFHGEIIGQDYRP